MTEREPTIEQKSQFHTTTQPCQNVEFETTIKFFISSVGDVDICAPGSKPHDKDTNTTKEKEKEKDKKKDDKTKKKRLEDDEEKNTKESKKKKKKLEEDDHHDSHGHKCCISENECCITGAPFECPITQFIPDPCRAIDDLQKGIRSLWTDFFQSSKCPPCPPRNSEANTDIQYPIDKGVALDSKLNKSNSEIIKNEQKFEV